MGIFGAGLRSPITESLRRQPQSLNPQVFARRQEMTLKPQRRTVGRVLADLVTPRTREGAQWARKISGALDWTSPTGADQPAQDAVAEFRKGNYGTSGLLGVMAAASLVPGVGTEAKTGKGLLGKFFEAYHGSPHTFDRFSLDKIGTGTGVSAFGHGINVSKSERVAKDYRDTLSSRAALVDGVRSRGGESDAHDVLSSNGWDIDRALEAAKDHLHHFTNVDKSYSKANAWSSILPVLQKWKETDAVIPNKGSLYHVRINADPSTFLNWNAPLSSQPEIAEKIIGAFPNPSAERLRMEKWTQPSWAGDVNQSYMDAINAGAQYNGLASTVGSYAEASKRLLDQGIPGVSYVGDNARNGGIDAQNYSIFDDSLIEILKRYGIVPPALVGGGMAAQQQNQMPQ